MSHASLKQIVIKGTQDFHFVFVHGGGGACVNNTLPPQCRGRQSAPLSQKQQTIGTGQLFGYQNMNMIIHSNRNTETPPLQSK